MPDRDQAKKEKALRIAYAKTFNSPEGRLVLADMMKQFSFINPGFLEDPRMMDFREGQRSVIGHVCSVMNVELKFGVIQEKPKRQEDGQDERADDSIGSGSFDFSTPNPLDP